MIEWLPIVIDLIISRSTIDLSYGIRYFTSSYKQIVDKYFDQISNKLIIIVLQFDVKKNHYYIEK